MKDVNVFWKKITCQSLKSGDFMIVNIEPYKYYKSQVVCILYPYS